MNLKNWVLKKVDGNLVDEISQGLNISSTCARVLINRGISSVDSARAYLNPELDNLHNPFLLPDIDKAVKRIRAAFDKKEKILIYGDSDVDGITSVCVLYNTIRSLGGNAVYYTPEDESYGLKKEVIEKHSKEGVRLIITVDSGISAFEEIVYANKLGLDTIVSDHHEPQDSGLPEAMAVIDPKRRDSKYPFSELAGCAVAFKLAEALMLSFGRYYDKEMIFLDLNENRVSALKSKNNLVLDEYSEEMDPKFAEKVFEKLSAFAGNGTIVCRGVLAEREQFKKIFGKILKNEHLDLKEIEEKYFNEAQGFTAAVPSAAGAAPEVLRVREKFLLHKRLEALDDLRMKYFRSSHLDVLALGTIADLVPLVNENRLIVKHGLRALSRTSKKGVRALVEKCAKGTGENISAKSISWDVTPVLNAAGRLGKSSVALELLLSNDEHSAGKLLEEILKLNSERKALQSENTERLIGLLDTQCDVENDPVLIVRERNIQQGLLGVVASQIVRQHGKPAIVILVNDEEAVGSCRSIPGFDFTEILGKLSGILIRFGGHAQAAGFTILPSKIDEFSKSIKDIVKKLSEEGAGKPDLSIDSELNSSDLSLGLLDELSALEPFGAGNPHPVFCLIDAKVVSVNTVGAAKNHLKLRVAKEKSLSIDAVGWNLGHLAESFNGLPLVDLAFNLEENTWQDRKSLQMKIVDIKTNSLILSKSE